MIEPDPNCCLSILINNNYILDHAFNDSPVDLRGHIDHRMLEKYIYINKDKTTILQFSLSENNVDVNKLCEFENINYADALLIFGEYRNMNITKNRRTEITLIFYEDEIGWDYL